MNSAWVPPPRAKQNFQSSTAGPVVVVDCLIHGMGVDLAGAVAVDRCPEVAEQCGAGRWPGCVACAAVPCRPGPAG
jgi:hypothetical protein